MDKTSFNHSEIKQATSTPKDKTGKDEKVEVTVELKACIECKYKCKKEDTLKKHMTTKHSEHKCKDCQEKLPTFMHLLKHVAQHHYKDQSEKQEEQYKGHPEDDAILNGAEENQDKEAYSFVFHESMLDEFL